MTQPQRLMHYQEAPLTLDRARAYIQSDERTTFTKPVGFWVSVEGEQDWPSWCRDNEYGVDDLAAAHEVRLSDSANIRRVTSVAEIDRLHDEFAAPTEFDRRYGYDQKRWGIDWAHVAQQYDGLIIAPYQWGRRLGPCDWYYTWDCASGYIWNLSAIESVALTSEVAA